MADFQTSTQRAKWILSPQELGCRYKAANQRAIEALEKFGAALMEVDADGSLSYPDPQINSKDHADKHSRPKSLSIEEEQFMRVFYENKLQEVCNNFHFPHKIQATALIYFKRFYLQWSVMQHNPKNVMLTCIYAACKIEENHVSAEELGKGISQDHQIILNYEMIVYQSLEFDLIVYAPYRSVEGYVNDIEELFHENAEMLQMLKVTASLEVDKIMLTDAPLLFPPGQVEIRFVLPMHPRKVEGGRLPFQAVGILLELALAALRRSNEVHGVIDFNSYLDSILSRQNSTHTISELYEGINAIESLVNRYAFPSEKDLKHINRKLKSCWGLGSNDESKKREKKSKHKSKRSSNEMQNRPLHN